MTRRCFAVVMLVLSVGCGSTPKAPPVSVPKAAAQTHADYARYAVASDHAIASEAGAAMLAQGGNAFDAAAAVSFALSVTRPYSCGIGGGGFLVAKRADGSTYCLDYRETAPAAAKADVFVNQPADASTKGGLAVAVPGHVAGVLRAQAKFGKLTRAQVLAPAIRAANEGFLVDAHYVGSTRELIAWFRAEPARQQRFAFVWERLLLFGNVGVGDRIRLPEQAEALRLIARDGERAFYDGPIAEAIVRAVKQAGGAITRDDLRGYEPKQREPLTFAALGRTFVTMPPPSSGGLALGQIVKLYEKTDRSPHALVESMKHAFADRARWLADPDFVEVPTQRLLSDAYLDQRRLLIGPTTLPSERYGTVPPPPDDGGTSHFCVVDAEGNAVAVTETINLIFGSVVAVPEFGFVLNNEMDDFTPRPGAVNAFGLAQSDRNLPAPGKRPLSSMTPTIVLGPDGQIEALAGAAGGPRIITGTLHVLLNAIERNDSAEAAMAAPRLHHQWQPDVVRYELGLENSETLAELRRRGHETRSDTAIANAQLIRRARSGTGWEAACDPRKGGRPAGE
jgi:gamma-glutamyltranspeptidase/glutathione hydrolase